MPGGDRKGPLNMGPLTGRGAGYCAGGDTPGSSNATPGGGRGLGWRGGGGGQGQGRRRGFGFSGRCGSGGTGGGGWRAWFPFSSWPGWLGSGAAPAAAEPGSALQRQVLADQARALRAELDAIERRLAELGEASQSE